MIGVLFSLGVYVLVQKDTEVSGQLKVCHVVEETLPSWPSWGLEAMGAAYLSCQIGGDVSKAV